MYSKELAANRGEIAIRAFRAAHELDDAPITVFPFEQGVACDPVGAIETMKISAPVSGIILRKAVACASQVEGDDLLVVVDSHENSGPDGVLEPGTVTD